MCSIVAGVYYRPTVQEKEVATALLKKVDIIS